MSERTWRIVTPEAVALDLEAAGLASRVIAALIDVFVMYVAATAVLGVLGTLTTLVGADSWPGVLIGVVVTVILFGFLVVWPVTWETTTHGRSLGKMAMGLRVVTVEGAPISFRHALVRGLLGVVELFLTLGSIALLVAMGSHRFRRLGDHMAGTVVIREKSSMPPARAVRFMPPVGWESFADSLDVSRLTPAHHHLVRAYLLRVATLERDTRQALGHEILDEVATATAMPPEVRAGLAHYDPTMPLTAIAAAYQRRFSPDPMPPPWSPYNGPFSGYPARIY